jgi:hypothetical protein
MSDRNHPGEPETVEIILEALKRAAEAHGEHEARELGGVHDVNWPEWYAEHMATTLKQLGYALEKIAP